MKGGEFLDTNIHIYSIDTASLPKKKVAMQLVDRVFCEQTGTISIQVFCEFFWLATRKIKNPLSSDKANSIIKNLSTWNVHSPNYENIENAIKKVSKYKISFWDAMILESAAAMNCHTLWSEDLHDGAVDDGVCVRNPFNPIRLGGSSTSNNPN